MCLTTFVRNRAACISTLPAFVLRSMDDESVIGRISAVTIILLPLWLLPQRIANDKSVFLRQVLRRAADISFAATQTIARLISCKQMGAIQVRV